MAPCSAALERVGRFGLRTILPVSVLIAAPKAHCFDDRFDQVVDRAGRSASGPPKCHDGVNTQ